jgi:hypothetical protein
MLLLAARATVPRVRGLAYVRTAFFMVVAMAAT